MLVGAAMFPIPLASQSQAGTLSRKGAAKHYITMVDNISKVQRCAKLNEKDHVLSKVSIERFDYRLRSLVLSQVS